MVGVDLLFKPDLNLLTRLGSSPNLGFFGIMAGSSSDILYSTFGVNMDLLHDSLWNEPCSNLRGLERPGPIQPGMLDFCPRTVQILTIAKSFSVLGRSQSFEILEWGLVNPEILVEFLDRMKVDMHFQPYYLSQYDSLRLLHKRSLTVPHKNLSRQRRNGPRCWITSWMKSPELWKDVKTRL